MCQVSPLLFRLIIYRFRHHRKTNSTCCKMITVENGSNQLGRTTLLSTITKLSTPTTQIKEMLPSGSTRTLSNCLYIACTARSRSFKLMTTSQRPRLLLKLIIRPALPQASSHIWERTSLPEVFSAWIKQYQEPSSLLHTSCFNSTKKVHQTSWPRNFSARSEAPRIENPRHFLQAD